MFQNPNTFVQFELWKDCSLGCRFCCNKGQPKIDKIQSLNFILEKLDEEEIQSYNEIGFIGGEFFNGELKNSNVKELFYKIFKKVSEINYQKIYITSALMFDITTYLTPFLDYLKELNVLDKVLICTSYDIEYRFRSNDTKELWKHNMKQLRNDYPQLGLHVETILTQSFINAVNDGTFNIKEFEQEYNVRIDYIEPSSGLYYKGKEDCSKDMPNFFPTKSSFVSFLKKVSVENNWIDLTSFLSMELRSNTLYYLVGNQRMCADNRRNGDGRCKLPTEDHKYEIGFIDSNISMKNIVNMFQSMI